MIFESLWIKIALAIGAALTGIAATYYFKMKPDNVIEQAAEMIILKEIGVDIDLSPEADIKDELKA